MHKSLAVRIAYGFIFGLSVILAWFLRDFGEQILGNISSKRIFLDQFFILLQNCDQI
jgi:hypothetical protein